MWPGDGAGFLGDTDDDALTVWTLLGSKLRRLHRFVEAEQRQRHLLAAVSDLPADRWRAQASAFAELASTRHAQGELPEAESPQEEAVRLLESGAAEDSSPDDATPDASVAHLNLAVVRMQCGKSVAVAALREHAARAWKLLGADDTATRAALRAVAVGQEMYTEATDHYQHLLDRAVHDLGEHDAESLDLLVRLFGTAGARGDDAGAAVLLHRFIKAAGVAIRSGHPGTLAAIEDMARALNDLGRPITVLAPLLKLVLQVRLHDLGEGNLETLRAYTTAALAASEQGALSDAVALRRGALRAAKALAPATPARLAEIADALFQLVLALDADHQHEEARVMEAEAVRSMKAVLLNRPDGG